MAEYDLVVIGGGPGGYVAAIRAAQLGLNTTLVEKQHLGGICLNWGCIPTKALLRSSEINHLLHNAEELGFKVGKVEVDFSKIIERSRGVATKLSAGIAHLLKKNKVPVIDGAAKLLPKKGAMHQIEVGGKVVSAKNVIIATGARARSVPGLEVDGKNIWSYKEAMTPKSMPKSLLIVGSGAIGIEFASFYRNMGVDVTVVELQDRILPVEDKEISELARKSFEKQGMKIMTSSTVSSVKPKGSELEIEIKTGDKASKFTFDKIISAVGIVGNIENIGLEALNIKTDRGHIVTNEWCETNVPGIYAIGDVAGAPWLAHKASHEGVLAVEKIKGHKGAHPIDKNNIPGCTYSRPQIASVGLTEDAAKAKGHELKVGRFPFIGNGKAIAMGEPEGLIKTIFDAKTGELLGAHMIGAEVTEMIQGFVIAKTLETTEEELMATIFPHPTLSEMMHESVLDAYGKVIHF